MHAHHMHFVNIVIDVGLLKMIIFQMGIQLQHYTGVASISGLIC